jgi:hypothetical protein
MEPGCGLIGKARRLSNSLLPSFSGLQVPMFQDIERRRELGRRGRFHLVDRGVPQCPCRTPFMSLMRTEPQVAAASLVLENSSFLSA